MKDRILIAMNEADARVLQHLADLCLHSVETCRTFNDAYREHYGAFVVGYPPVPLKGTPSQAVARACSAIAIALSEARDAERDQKNQDRAVWRDVDTPEDS